MADGNHLRVTHPEFLSHSPSGRTAIVFGPGETFEVVDLLRVASIEVGHGTAKREASR